MKENRLAIITGADGGMGQVITKRLALEGYKIIMACLNQKKAQEICESIKSETGNQQIEVRYLQLNSLHAIHLFCNQIKNEKQKIDLLINNAGILTTKERKSEDGLESIVSVNYVGPFFMTRLLIPCMKNQSRIINTVSCTYAIGKIDNKFFLNGKSGQFSRIPVYGNTKLALLLFTRELNERLCQRGIMANAADPGIVNTNMITMHKWFDPLTDILFRPFIKTPEQGAATALFLALSPQINSGGSCYANCRKKNISARIFNSVDPDRLWEETEAIIRSKGFDIPAL